MATLHQDVNMPYVRDYFAQELPKVSGNQRVWAAFLKWSGYQVGNPQAVQQQALAAIAGNMGPKVKIGFVYLPDSTTGTTTEGNGIFYPKDPETIIIHMDIAYFYNRNINSQTHMARAIQLIESTSLHELVHYLNWKHLKKVRFDGVQEMGVEFEMEAYRRNIGNEGWWRKVYAEGAYIPEVYRYTKVPSRKGTFVRVQAAGAELVMLEENGKQMVHKLAPTVEVIVDNRPARLQDLRPGQRIRAMPARIEALDKNSDFMN